MDPDSLLDYTHDRLKFVIKKIKEDELALMDDKVKGYMKNYPFINEPKDCDDDRKEKIKPRSQWMHHMLLDNGADVNFPCTNQTNASPLSICLAHFPESLDHTSIFEDLLRRQAKLTQAEIPILNELFVKVSSTRDDDPDLDAYFGILEHVAKNSSVLLQHISDLHGNNPIHTTIDQNKDTHNATENARQARILSQLLKRYPFWIKERNIAGDYPLLLSVRYRDVASIFGLLSFLSAHDYDAMNHMIQQRAFVESMIAWVMDLLTNDDDSSHDIEVIKIFLELYGYEMIFCWPNPFCDSLQAPITLIDVIETQEETLRDVMLDILIKKCNVLKYVQSKTITEKMQHGRQLGVEVIDVDYEFPNLASKQQPILNPNEKQKTIDPFHSDTDQNESEDNHAELEEKEDAEKELDGDDVDDIDADDADDEETEPLDDDTNTVNWIELFYSLLIESFSTADLYTDIIIMIGLFKT
eukprot:711560_1